MKSMGWKDSVELIGMAAIVASLFFVGEELRQSRDIALSERAGHMMLAEIEARRPIYEYPDIWARGNAGEELNPSEAVIYRTLIQDINSWGFFRRLSATAVDSQGAADAAGWDMAGFLYDNPGARREWEALRDRIRRHREPHVSGEYRSDYEEDVRANLEVLDRTYNP
ncbi:MAG: hypothetical protein ABF290_04070 [Thiogranum sp.]